MENPGRPPTVEELQREVFLIDGEGKLRGDCVRTSAIVKERSEERFKQMLKWS
jgi:hypothetical protein